MFDNGLGPGHALRQLESQTHQRVRQLERFQRRSLLCIFAGGAVIGLGTALALLWGLAWYWLPIAGLNGVAVGMHTVLYSLRREELARMRGFRTLWSTSPARRIR